jgi:ribosomal protein S18 acetylase RimI-like enzyme
MGILCAFPGGVGRGEAGMTIRGLRAEDRGAVDEALSLCGAFSQVEIRVALEMFDLGIAGEYSLLGIETSGILRSYACFGKASLTLRSWYLYWICVHPDVAGTGVAQALERAVADSVRRAGGDKLVLEASGRPDQERARRFYQRAGFNVAGRIPNFYGPGDDCVIYCKPLEAAS